LHNFFSINHSDAIDVPITVLEHLCAGNGQNRLNLHVIAPLMGLIIPNAPNQGKIASDDFTK